MKTISGKKDVSFELKQLNDDGTFSGYASVFGVEDQGQDIVMKGAFTASIADMKSKNRTLPMLWSHDSSTPIGGYSELKEDDYGLFCQGAFTPGVAKAAETHALMKAGVVTGLSIGFQSQDYEYDTETNIRKLIKVKLFEISPVTFPMLDIARVSDVKSLFAELDERELEEFCKENNFTKVEAVRVVGVVKKYLRRDASEDTKTSSRRDAGADDLLKSVREMRASFKSFDNSNNA